VDFTFWDKDLKRYVNPQGLVDYSAWKKKTNNLDRFLSQIATADPSANETEEKCLLINGYNAAVLKLTLDHYPLETIQDIKGTFTEKRFQFRHTRVSLDDLENRLRGKGDPRIHAALVSAAVSSCLLRREAYVPTSLDAQLDDQVHIWLSNERWNHFQPEQGRAEVSAIFKWYEGDFERNGRTVRDFLRENAPRKYVDFLSHSDYEIAYMPFDWSLNDQSASTRFYLLSRLWSRVKNWIPFGMKTQPRP
jgi:hypothetical protein